MAVGIGVALCGASTVARETFQEVDDALKQKLAALMAEGPERDLTLTENAQPAIMATTALDTAAYAAGSPAAVDGAAAG